MTSSSLTLSTLAAFIASLKVRGQRLLEAADVGAALGGGDHVDERAELGVVAGPPAHRDVDVELALDLLRGHVALVVEQRHGLGERVPALQPQDVGDRLVVGQELGELGDAAVVAELLLAHLRAAQVADDQLEAGHDERRLPGPAEQVLEDERRVLGEDLPVRPEPDPGAGPGPWRPGSPLRVSPDFAVNDAVGPSPSKTPGTPRRKDIPCWDGDRSTSTSSRADSALTTEAPTPCRPPVAT